MRSLDQNVHKMGINIILINVTNLESLQNDNQGKQSDASNIVSL